MKLPSHWTSRYVRNRLLQIAYRFINRFSPQVSRRIIPHLSVLIKPHFVGLEIGAGASTIWFARRCYHLSSIEHSEKWHRKVQDWIKKKKLEPKVTLYFAELASPGIPNPYLGAIKKIPNGSLDFVLVDGKYRDAVALASTNKIKSGGLLIIDDVHRYLPRVIPSSAPFARSNLAGCASDLWREFEELTASWEQVWRSDGIQDTVIFIKPIGD